MTPKYVIIGGSAGGIGAIEAIREVDPFGQISVISEELFPQYSRPMIAEFLSKRTTLEKMRYRDKDFWIENEVQNFTGRKAVKLDTRNRVVHLDNGQELEYDKLLIATGGKPYLPEIDGINKDGVFTFVTLSDATKLAIKIKEKPEILILGGGLIGISLADALAKLQIKVTIVEFRERILSLILDEIASKIVEKAVKNAGVKIITGQTIKKILGKSFDNEVVGGAILTNGQCLHCDIIVVTIGVIPRIEIVSGTDIEVDRGIIVDRFMRTNNYDVYACGDVAETYDFILGENRQLPLLPLAYEGGKVAGYNMAARKTEYKGGTAMSALNYFSTPVVSLGTVNLSSDNKYETLTNYEQSKEIYKKIILKDNLIEGFIFLNDIKQAGILFYLMKNRIEIGAFKKELLTPDFGLARLPAKIRKRMFGGNRSERV